MEQFKHHIFKIYGQRGVDWLSGLPDAIERLKPLWGLSELKPFPKLSYNYVLEGVRGNIPIILKLSPDIDLMDKETKTLEAFKGFGAVSVLGSKDGILLLERIVPGDQLKNSLPKKKRIEIACNVIKRLHQAPIPSKTEFPSIEEWLETLEEEWDLPKEPLNRARKLKTKLLKKASNKKVLLHGDLHQENILFNGSSWTVIDPKGVIGDPIHEIWACIEDPGHDLKYLANYFGYSLQDVVEWYYVHLILASCWQAEDSLDASRFLILAQSVLPMIEP